MHLLILIPFKQKTNICKIIIQFVDKALSVKDGPEVIYYLFNAKRNK